MFSFGEHDAVIVVDVQNDFLPGGALGVPRGDEVVPRLNDVVRAASAAGVPVFATRDWHPPHHCSFRERGGPWPPHCIQGTKGAELAPGLVLPPSATIVSKGFERDRDAYSGFDGTELGDKLRALGVRRVLVGGLATDYCVRQTVLDARDEGFDVVLLEDAVRPVEVRPGDGERAKREMLDRGARAIRSEEIPKAA